MFQILSFALFLLFFNNFYCSFGRKIVNNTKRTIIDDYYLNYDYDLTNINNNKANNNGTNQINFHSDSLILPNPETLDSKYSVDVLPKIELPDDSLADTDLRDHDFIDNIMYVYYGSQNRNSNKYGPEIIIIGSVLSCAAQLLTICCILLTKNANGKKELKQIFLHLMCCFCISNLLFMLGVYATKNSIKCLLMSLTLHYLHLLTALWMFLYCYYIYKRFSTSTYINIKYFNLIAYGVPLIFSMVSYMITPHSYESKRFCFISVQKGMILNYMLPVSILIILTTLYSLNGIRKINMELSKLELNSSAESLNALRNELDLIDTNKKQDQNVDGEVISLRQCKTCLKLLCGIQTGYDIVWFIVVLALENVNENNSMSIIYAVISCILNWYIFVKKKSFLPAINNTIAEIINENKADNEKEEIKIKVSLSRCGSSDSIPLLDSESCTEMRELRQDFISTISN